MPNPRYRVRTLLVATTLAAVVVACLAPWLRGISPEWWTMLASRVGVLVLGAGISVVFAVVRYHYFVRQARSSGTAILSKCKQVRSNLRLGAVFLALLFPVLLMIDGVVLRLQESASSPKESWILWGMVAWQYLMMGSFVGYLFNSSPACRTPVWLTKQCFVSRGITTRWKPGMRFLWTDRAAGKMLLILPMIGRYELSIDEDQIDAAEQLLTKNLPPWH